MTAPQSTPGHAPLASRTQLLYNVGNRFQIVCASLLPRDAPKMSHTALIAHKIGPYGESVAVTSMPDAEADEGNIVVTVESCGLAFPDILTVEGRHVFKREAPFVPGSEVAGVVKAIGKGVTRFKVRQVSASLSACVAVCLSAGVLV